MFKGNDNFAVWNGRHTRKIKASVCISFVSSQRSSVFPFYGLRSITFAGRRQSKEHCFTTNINSNYGFFCFGALDEREKEEMERGRVEEKWSSIPSLESTSVSADVSSHTRTPRKNNAIDLNRTIDTEQALVQTKQNIVSRAFFFMCTLYQARMCVQKRRGRVNRDG